MKKIIPFLVVVCVSVIGLMGCATYTPPPEDVSAASPDSDTQLARLVQQRLDQDTVAGRGTYGVTVENGIVTVQGAVPEETARARVLGVVRSTPGVKGVVDKLYRW